VEACVFSCVARAFDISRGRRRGRNNIIKICLEGCSIKMFADDTLILGVKKVWTRSNISIRKSFTRKCFRQKLYGFKGDIRWCH